MRPLALVLLSGFLSSLFGCSKGEGDKPRRYVGEAAHRENLASQQTASPQIIAELRKRGVADNAKLKLEFFFYTDDDAKGQALVKNLKGLGYQAECRPSAGDPRQFLVTGWTTPIKMSENTVVAWAEKMCQIGYEHDCEFDGWGTNPKQ